MTESNVLVGTKGIVVVISGPSGVGKGTIIQRMLAKSSQVKLAVSATTRPPRNGEVNGKDYHFLTDAEFDQFITKDAFVEWCDVHGRRYGTLVSEVSRITNEGLDVVLEIDTQGARKVRANVSQILSIFIAPPSMAELGKRLTERNTDTMEQIARRLAVANEEMADIHRYDGVVVNAEIDGAVTTVFDMIQTYKNQVKGDQHE